MNGLLILPAGSVTGQEGFVEFTGVLAGGALDWERYRGFGEVVFNTGMSGYQEILTDPSYAGQMVVMTSPHIGNTGLNPIDPESPSIQAAGLIVHELTHSAQHWQATDTLVGALSRAGVPILHQVDTRALTRRLRTAGVTRGILCHEKDRDRAIAFLRSPTVAHADEVDWLGRMGSGEKHFAAAPARGTTLFKVVALDFGIKGGLIRELQHRGCDITVVSALSSPPAILEREPDGVFLSNGPGDPAKAVQSTRTVAQLVGKVPIFGVCMGHQVLGQALGARTFKLKFGHRGANQPVLRLDSGRVEISSHNHGYAVDVASLPESIEATHTHLNDQSLEGLRWKGSKAGSGLAPAFSVQYHPEASPGPHDSANCFDEFIEDMKAWASQRHLQHDVPKIP